MTTNNALFLQISQTLEQIIVGQSSIIEQLLIALLSGGHVILEGVPGTGKTLLVKVLSQLIKADFRRIQLTPDILPSDILGTNIFDFNTRDFTLKEGPIFTEILLADEINRTPPKTQSALLEAMQEQQVTLDGKTRALSPLFWVIATQNSLEFEGTYPLPEAQLDRFVFKLLIDYPDRSAEKQMLIQAKNSSQGKSTNVRELQPIATIEDILTAREAVQKVEVKENIINYLLDLLEKTRQHPDVALGASPRAAVIWLQTSKAKAWFAGRNYVTPDDVKTIAIPLLRHRLILNPEAQLEGVNSQAVIESILKQVDVPR
ncbi:AAA family ATPase [Crocosphaera sp. Alani8]|uniref:AAA family ATPase n=1 Tax=Crocosphaera sp. Alani8 TaxID=3038952 RepID=UPI00313DFE06